MSLDLNPHNVFGSEHNMGELHLSILNLNSRNDILLANLEDVRSDLAAQQLDAEQRATRDAAEIARFKHVRDELEREDGAKRRKITETEERVLAMTKSNADLKEKHEESLSAFRREVDSLREERAAQVEQLCEELTAERSGASLCKLGRREVDNFANWEVQALRSRLEELQHQAQMHKMLIDQSAREREINTQLLLTQRESEVELRSAKEVHGELHTLRQRIHQLEQDGHSSRTALEARTAALKFADEVAAGALSAQRDLNGFVTTAAYILSDMAAYRAEKDKSTETTTDPTAVTPKELKAAWAQFFNEVSDLRRSRDELKVESNQFNRREKLLQTEWSRLGLNGGMAQAETKQLQADLRHAREEVSVHAARANVLRDAISRGAASLSEVPPEMESFGTELHSMQRRVTDLESIAKAKDVVMQQQLKEIEALQQENVRLSLLEDRTRTLESENVELWKSKHNLCMQVVRQHEAELNALVEDADVKSAKLLHLIPGLLDEYMGEAKVNDTVVSRLCAENAALRDDLKRVRAAAAGSGAIIDGLFLQAGDAEKLQAARQLDRAKKAMKKCVQEFRAGIFCLLGWKLEMKGDNNLTWHFTSRYQPGKELVFLLRPADVDNETEFDLLSTPWAEQLQEDKQTMAYLNVYRSIPGFLAHITTDLLSRQTLPS